MSYDAHGFTGCTVIVTGARAGIGRATPERLVREGCRVTSIEVPFRSGWGPTRLGPFFQTDVPPVARPEQLAAAITRLLSVDEWKVSGSVLPVDGGWAAI